MKIREIHGYRIRTRVAACTACGAIFATDTLVGSPTISEFDHIEADLHRAMPDAAIRGTLIAVCPECNYAGWTVGFTKLSLKPELLADPLPIEATKRFAMAIKSGR